MISNGIESNQSLIARSVGQTLGIITFAAALWVAPSTTEAATILVGAGGAPEAPTLSAAVAFANSGDTLLLQEGTYVEIITTDKALTIKAADQSIVTLNGNNFGAALTFVGVDGDVVLEGISVQNGFNQRGGGVKIDGVSGKVTITNCDFFGNIADRTGGALDVYDAVVTIRDCTFEGNVVNGSNELKGGAIALRGEVSGSRIEDCEFISNEADYGGAVWFQDGCTIRNCTFTRNDSEKGGGVYGNSVDDAEIRSCTFDGNTAAQNGGGLYVSGNGVQVKYCTFKENATVTSGGGIYLGSGSDAEILWNVFDGNTAAKGGGVAVAGMLSRLYRNTFYANAASDRGAGLHIQQTSADIHQNIFANHTGSAAVYCEITSSPSFVCSMMWSNGAGHFDGNCDPIDDDGNFVSDPLFCDAPEGDFGVDAGSEAATGNEPADCANDAIGAGGASCGATPVVVLTWGGLKARFAN